MRSRIFLIALFFLFATLLLLQMATGFANEEELHGVETPADDARPEFHRRDFFSQQFQSSFEAWLERNIGFRGLLVRTDNQMNYSLFGEISSNYASPLVVGRDSTLFEKLYIDSINGYGFQSDKDLRRIVRKLLRLQENLRARGITFVLFVTPSKASIELDAVPKKYLDPNRPKDSASNYARLLPIVHEAGVNVLDGKELLLRWKQESTEPLFAKGGTHWTMDSACKVSSELMNVLEKTSGKKMTPVVCVPTEMKDVPEPFDRDLADLTNLWNPQPFYQRLPYPREAPPSDSAEASRPRMLFVGGSFLWSVFHYLDLYRVYSERDMFYYFSRRFHYPGSAESPLDHKTLDWEGDVFRNDFIILEVNEANIQSLTGGFVDAALAKSAPQAALQPIPKQQQNLPDHLR